MKIRLARPDDAEAIAAIYAPIVLETTISFEWVPPTVEAFRQRIVKTLAKYPWLVAVDVSNQVAGFVYASSHRDPPSYQWSVNTSVFIRDDCRGRGVGKALYIELFRQLLALGYYRAFAGVALQALPCTSRLASRRSASMRRSASNSGLGETWPGSRRTFSQTRSTCSRRDPWIQEQLPDVAPRKVFAAATMLVSAGITSLHWRVLRPQSGFTHSRWAGMRSAAFFISCTMCSCVGIFGEWMS